MIAPWTNGDTPEASEFNKFAEVEALFFNSQKGLSTIVKGLGKAIVLKPSNKRYGVFEFKAKNLNPTKDILCQAIYEMSGADASKQALFKLSYEVSHEGGVKDSGNATKEINTVNTADTQTTQDFNDELKIPNADLDAQTDTIRVKFERINTGLSGTNNSHNFELFYLKFYQK